MAIMEKLGSLKNVLNHLSLTNHREFLLSLD
jgi:hypothetical protein